MKAKEYLKQAYRLDQRINSNIKEVGELRAMAGSISSPQLSADKVQTSHNGDAPFERALMRIWEMESKIDAEIDLYVDLKNQIREVISQIDNVDEQMVLRYRYIHNKTWEQIGMELFVDKSTVKRWHDTALTHVIVPENPILISQLDENEPL